MATDRFGDPLPAGAIARLGTTRLRHGAEIRALEFLADGTLVSAGADTTLRGWDAATGRETFRLALDVPVLARAPDGRVLAAAEDRELDAFRTRDAGRTVRRRAA